jgi:hypothetical protein
MVEVALVELDVPLATLMRLPTCVKAFAIPVTLVDGAPIDHAGLPPGEILMNCCRAVTDATVETSFTVTFVVAVEVPHGVGSAAISAEYWFVPAPPELPPVEVM